MRVIQEFYRQQANLWDYCLGKRTHNSVFPQFFLSTNRNYIHNNEANRTGKKVLLFLKKAEGAL